MGEKKKIPNGLKLTPLICLLWYIGDGALCHHKRGQHIQLSTDCFTYEEVLYLCSQLKDFCAKPKRNNKVYRIHIPRNKILDFLSYIGDCPFDDYAYKWNYKEYINSPPRDLKYLEPIICEMYQNNTPYYHIAKELHINHSLVKYYLLKNNLYKSKKDDKTKNAVVQIDRYSNEYLNIFENSRIASKYLGGKNGAGIIAVCGGYRETALGYKWKKFIKLSAEEQKIIKQQFVEYFK